MRIWVLLKLSVLAEQKPFEREIQLKIELIKKGMKLKLKQEFDEQFDHAF